MSRSTQIVGLKEEALDFLEKEAKRVPKNTCPTCHHTKGGEIIRILYDEKTGARAGMCDDGPLLFEYHLKNNQIVKEAVQEVPWSSGPCIFLCLEDINGKRLFEWTDKEITEECGSTPYRGDDVEETAKKMIEWGADKELINSAEWISCYNEGVTDLILLWNETGDEEDRKALIADLTEAVDDNKRAYGDNIPKNIIEEKK
jgi:hypothetical protein